MTGERNDELKAALEARVNVNSAVPDIISLSAPDGPMEAEAPKLVADLVTREPTAAANGGTVHSSVSLHRRDVRVLFVCSMSMHRQIEPRRLD